jgi:D-galactarolactone cycloisomerase
MGSGFEQTPPTSPIPRGFLPTPAHTLAPTRIELFRYKAAIREPIATSFGSIPARNARPIRIEDQDGAFG